MKAYLFILVSLFGLGMNVEVGWGDDVEELGHGSTRDARWEIKEVNDPRGAGKEATGFKEFLRISQAQTPDEIRKIFEETENREAVADRIVPNALKTLSAPDASSESKEKATDMLIEAIRATSDKTNNTNTTGSDVIQFLKGYNERNKDSLELESQQALFGAVWARGEKERNSKNK